MQNSKKFLPLPAAAAAATAVFVVRFELWEDDEVANRSFLNRRSSNSFCAKSDLLAIGGHSGTLVFGTAGLDVNRQRNVFELFII